MSAEILRRLDELKAGQDALRSGQDALRDELRFELRASQDALRSEFKAGQDALRAELLVAVRESNEAVLGATGALHASLHELRSSFQDFRRSTTDNFEVVIRALEALGGLRPGRPRKVPV